MKNSIKKTLLIFLSFAVFTSLMFVVFSLFVQSTILSNAFYDKITPQSDYVPLIKKAIIKDLMAQSSYVNIPIETLEAGLDDKVIFLLIKANNHNASKFFALKSDYITSKYPSTLFKDKLLIFIEDYASKNKIEVSQQQLNLLDTVASDSAKIVDRHTNLINIDLFNKIDEFKIIQKIIFNIGKFLIIGVILLIVLICSIIIICRKNKSSALLYIFSSVWITGVLVAVPAIMFGISGLSNRLAIKTEHIKLALDNAFFTMNSYFVIFGGILFIVATIVLVARIFYPFKNSYENY